MNNAFYHTIGCEKCGNTMNLSIVFKFIVEHSCCSNCHDTKTKAWDFHFCDMKCFDAWFQKIKKTGIPCRDCYGKGFLGGFESNGKCPTCHGKKYINKLVMKGFAKAPKMPKDPEIYSTAGCWNSKTTSTDNSLEYI